MRIIIASMPMLALVAILSTCASQRLEYVALLTADAGALPEVTQILQNSKSKSLKRAAALQLAQYK